MLLSIIVGATIVIFVWLLDNQNKKSRNRTDYYSMSYRQGYWDGVKAAESGQVSTKDQVSYAPAHVESNTHPVQQSTAQVDDAYMLAIQAQEPAAQPIATIASPIAYSQQPAAPILREQPPHRAAEPRHQTINIALYVASLLLVSGVILLAQTIGLADGLKFALVWLMILVYYVAGFVLIARVPLLKPAAVTFVGTALASIPVAGITMYYLVSKNAALCWLITSLIGTVLYVFATVRLRSQFLAYISILSFFIFSITLPAVAQAQLIWYYVVMIAFGSLLTLLSYFKIALVPKVFAEPINYTSPIGVPLALAASFVSFMVMSPVEYAAVFGAASLFYTAQALTARSNRWRTVAWTAARSLIMLCAVSVAAAMSDRSIEVISVTLVAAAFVNIAVSLANLKQQERSGTHHEIMLWVSIGAMFVATMMVGDIWHQDHAFIASVHLAVITFAAVTAAVRLKRLELAWPALASLTALPAMVMLYVIQPAVNQRVLAITYIVFVLLALLIRVVIVPRQASVHARSLVYVSIAIWMNAAASSMSGLDTAWWAAWWALLAAVCYVITWIERGAVALVFGNGALLIAAWLVGERMGMSNSTIAVSLVFIHMAVSIGMSELFARTNPTNRGLFHTSTISSIVYGSILALGTFVLVETDQLRTISWLSLVTILYWSFWRIRSLSVLVLAHITASIEILLVSRMAGFSWLLSLGITAWVALIGLVTAEQVTKNRNIRESQVHRQTGLIIAITLGTLSLVVSGESSAHVVVWSAAVMAMYYSSWKRRSVPLLYTANAAMVLLMTLTCSWGKLSFTLAAVCIAWASIFGFYGAGRVYREKFGSIRVWQAMFLSAIVTSLVASSLTLFASSSLEVLAGSLALMAAGLLLCYDDYEFKRLHYVDLGAIIAMFGLQRAIGVMTPGLDSLVYTHLWAFLLIGLWSLYYKQGKKIHAQTRLVFALIVLSIPALFAALDGGTGYQILFLIEHALMVVVGLARAYRLLTIWGAIGVSFAVLYMLRGYTSLLTITIGLAIIGVVVWVIVRNNTKTPPPLPPTTPA
ncbi:MAG: hypothetical protein KA604_03110 [Candidatus Saccharimonas sp.]|nr:hypothetical protein [Candidatus Saccharimonas sp.]